MELVETVHKAPRVPQKQFETDCSQSSKHEFAFVHKVYRRHSSPVQFPAHIPCAYSLLHHQSFLCPTIICLRTSFCPYFRLPTAFALSYINRIRNPRYQLPRSAICFSARQCCCSGPLLCFMSTHARTHAQLASSTPWKSSPRPPPSPNVMTLSPVAKLFSTLLPPRVHSAATSNVVCAPA